MKLTHQYTLAVTSVALQVLLIILIALIYFFPSIPFINRLNIENVIAYLYTFQFLTAVAGAAYGEKWRTQFLRICFLIVFVSGLIFMIIGYLFSAEKSIDELYKLLTFAIPSLYIFQSIRELIVLYLHLKEEGREKQNVQHILDDSF